MGTPWWRDTHFDRRVLQRGKIAGQTFGSGTYQRSGRQEDDVPVDHHRNLIGVRGEGAKPT